MNADTIFAVASGSGQAALAVMRVSGAASRGILASLCGRVPAPRRASFRRLRDVEGSELDQGMVVWPPGPAATPADIGGALSARRSGGADGGGRCTGRAWRAAAEAGEFTRRAFLNGRMDLTEAEAVHDLWRRRPKRSGARRCVSSMVRWARCMATGRSDCACCWRSRRP